MKIDSKGNVEVSLICKDNFFNKISRTFDSICNKKAADGEADLYSNLIQPCFLCVDASSEKVTPSYGYCEGDPEELRSLIANDRCLIDDLDYIANDRCLIGDLAYSHSRMNDQGVFNYVEASLVAGVRFLRDKGAITGMQFFTFTEDEFSVPVKDLIREKRLDGFLMAEVTEDYLSLIGGEAGVIRSFEIFVRSYAECLGAASASDYRISLYSVALKGLTDTLRKNADVFDFIRCYGKLLDERYVDDPFLDTVSQDEDEQFVKVCDVLGQNWGEPDLAETFYKECDSELIVSALQPFTLHEYDKSLIRIPRGSNYIRH